MTDNVRVAIRCRPLSEKEIADGYQSIVEFEGNRLIVEGSNDQPASKPGGEDKRSFLREYEFDQVFDWNSSQEDVYDKSCRPIVDSVLEGFNGTIFAYGQTGTGKTYTMEGSTQRKLSLTNRSVASAAQSTRKLSTTTINQISSTPRSGSGIRDNNKKTTSNQQLADNFRSEMETFQSEHSTLSSMGVIPRTFKHIFKHIADHPEIQFLIRVSYLEIYQENIHDLLRKDQSMKLELHERPDIGVYVKDLTTFFCKSITEIERVMRVGNQNRRVGATDMNEHSSRSHAIFMITVEQQSKNVVVAQSSLPEAVDTKSPRAQSSKALETKERINSITNDISSKTTKPNQDCRIIKVGKLNLIDLAGSESQKKTNSFGERQKESVKINLSLSALGNVINSLMKANSLAKKQSQSQQQQQHYHVPYRDSKLTRLLQDSLGGNAKTLMIANIGPASYNYDETISTLEYASRAKLIRNKPRLNEDPKDALLRELQKEIGELRQKLAEIDGGGGGGGNGSGSVGFNLRKNSREIDTLNSQQRKQSTSSSQQQQQVNNYKQQRRDSGDKKLLRNQIGQTTNRPIDDVDQKPSDRQLVERELQDLKQKLASLESKLLNADNAGGVDSFLVRSVNYLNPVDKLENYMKRQEAELEAKRLELAKQSSRESAIRDELERKEEVELLTKEAFSSTKQEFDAKKRLIRQILVKVKQMRDSIENLEQTYTLELDELDQLQYELSRELKLKCLIMDNFVPSYHVNQLLPRICYNDSTNKCIVKPFDEFPDDKCIHGEGGLRLKSKSDNIGGLDGEDNHEDDASPAIISYDEFWRKIIDLGNNNTSLSRSSRRQLTSSGSASGSAPGSAKQGQKKQPKEKEFATQTSLLVRPKTEFEAMEATLFPENLRFKRCHFIDLKSEHEPIADGPLLSASINPSSSSSSSVAQNRSLHSFDLDKLHESINKMLDVQEQDIVI